MGRANAIVMLLLSIKLHIRTREERQEHNNGDCFKSEPFLLIPEHNSGLKEFIKHVSYLLISGSGDRTEPEGY